MTRVSSSSPAEMASEDCCMGDDCRTADKGLGETVACFRRGDVRSTGDSGTGCVSTPGRGMSKERSSAAAGLCCVRSGVISKLCSGWCAWNDRGGCMADCWVSSGVRRWLSCRLDCCAECGAGGELRRSSSPSIGNLGSVIDSFLASAVPSPRWSSAISDTAEDTCTVALVVRAI